MDVAQSCICAGFAGVQYATAQIQSLAPPVDFGLTIECVMALGLHHCSWAVCGRDYTTVHTVFNVVSNRTALASVGFMLVSYIGFSNDAWPFELS